MVRMLTLLVFAGGLLAADANADTSPANDRMLVATELIQGEVFARTVIVLLHYDSTGAMGLVVNRPTEVPVAEVLPDDAVLPGYEGDIYWGGPVQMDALRALLRTDKPPEDAQRLVGSVYLVSIDDELMDGLEDSADLRLYLGYAGWSPGQLDRELATGSWIIVPTTEDRVFPEDPTRLWKKLVPRAEHRAANRKEVTGSGL